MITAVRLGNMHAKVANLRNVSLQIGNQDEGQLDSSKLFLSRTFEKIQAMASLDAPMKENNTLKNEDISADNSVSLVQAFKKQIDGVNIILMAYWQNLFNVKKVW